MPAIMDVVSVPAVLGLALGRIGNITNGEFGMYSWYEAGVDILIAAVCYLLLRSSSPLPFWEREGGEGFACRSDAPHPRFAQGQS